MRNLIRNWLGVPTDDELKKWIEAEVSKQNNNDKRNTHFLIDQGIMAAIAHVVEPESFIDDVVERLNRKQLN